MGAEPAWLTVFLDVPSASHATACAFWPSVTGGTLSSRRGAYAEFATLEPAAGDPHLRLQSTGAASFRTHLDLHVDDVSAWADRAAGLGATVLARPGHVVLRSPAGFDFCLVPLDGSGVRTPPASWPGHRSIADQLTIDVTPSAWEAEQAFWSVLTGWDVVQAGEPAYARLQTPASLPVRVLLQRLDDGATSGHLDIATDDRIAETARLVGLGASVTHLGRAWTTLRGPDGSVFCVTDRDPGTGLRPA